MVQSMKHALASPRRVAVKDLHSRLRLAYGTIPVLVKKFNDGKHYSVNLIDRLDTMVSLLDPGWKDYSKIRGKAVLDVGSGTELKKMNKWRGFGEHEQGSKQFQPWLCRSLHELGAQSFGIDIDINPGTEKFKAICFNICKDDLEAHFALNSLDIVHSHLLLPPNTSPLLIVSARRHILEIRQNEIEDCGMFVHQFFNIESNIGQKIIDPRVTLEQLHGSSEFGKVVEAFIAHISMKIKAAAEHLLREGGILLLEDRYWINNGGKLGEKIEL